MRIYIPTVIINKSQITNILKHNKLEEYIEFVFKSAISIRNKELKNYSQEDLREWETKDSLNDIDKYSQKKHLEIKMLKNLLLNLDHISKENQNKEKIVLSLKSNIEESGLDPEDVKDVIKKSLQNSKTQILISLSKNAKDIKKIKLIQKEFNNLISAIQKESITIS